MKLNGWQRLWVLVSIIYLIPVVFITLSALPTKNQIYQEWYYEIFRYAKHYSDFQNISSYDYQVSHENLSIYELIQSIELQLKPVPNQDMVLANSNIKIPYDVLVHQYNDNVISIHDKYTNDLNKLHINQAKIALTCLVILWIIPLLIIYLLGKAIGWVYRGFKSSDDNS